MFGEKKLLVNLHIKETKYIYILKLQLVLNF